MRIAGRGVAVWLLGLVLGLPVAAFAEEGRATVAVEGHGGWAGFLDDATIHHGYLGAGARVQLTPRLSLGPEVTYMVGPDDDRDLFVVGALTVDFANQRQPRPRVSPFLVVGGGFMTHRDRFGDERFSHTEGALTGGLGVRVHVTDRVYFAPEVRVGWEPHLRIGVIGGIRLGR